MQEKELLKAEMYAYLSTCPLNHSIAHKTKSNPLLVLWYCIFWDDIQNFVLWNPKSGLHSHISREEKHSFGGMRLLTKLLWAANFLVELEAQFGDLNPDAMVKGKLKVMCQGGRQQTSLFGNSSWKCHTLIWEI
jgi:hypothetical protein